MQIDPGHRGSVSQKIDFCEAKMQIDPGQHTLNTGHRTRLRFDKKRRY